MDLGLRGRRCVVTGASRGIGLAVVELLVAEGADVIAVARDPSAAAGLDGASVRTLALDVTAPDAGEVVLETCGERGADVLVNGAGTSAVRPHDEIPDDEWQAQWELNVMGPMRLMRALLPGMAQRGWGRVVNVASSAGKRPSSMNMAYSAGKAGELSISRAFAELYAGRGVTVNAVAPGMVASGLWTGPGGMADQLAAQQGVDRDEALAAQSAKIPRGRMGTPEEVAAVVVFLCSAAAANVTGAAWSADGGSVAIVV